MEINVWKSEIEARTAVGDYESAIALAQSVLLQEDRLHLLTLIAKAQRESGGEPDEEIIEQIEQLVDRLNDLELGDRAVEIATDLVSVHPGLALALVENGNPSTTASENVLDWAFLRLSLAAINSDIKDDFGIENKESFASRISNPKTRSFAIATSLIVEDYAASTIIQETEKLEQTGEQIFLLRKWLLRNRERKDAAEVVEYALNTLIKTTEYSPTARDYREIATPLPYVKDIEKSQDLLYRLDGQKGTIEHLGPTIDFVRLQLLLAETEITYDLDAASSRLTDIYIYIDGIEELAVKAECTARFASALERIDPENTVKMGLIESIENDLKELNQRLLSDTAQQEIILNGPVRALAKNRFRDALELACSLNTEPRRVIVLSELIDSVLQLPVDKIDFSELYKAIAKYENDYERDEALLQILSHLAAEADRLNEQRVRQTLPIIQLCSDVHESESRCYACCLAIVFLSKSICKSQFAGMIEHLLTVLLSSWESIDRQWQKVDVGFKISSMLAEYDIACAKRYLDLAEECSNKASLNSEDAVHVYNYCLSLTLRVYGGIVAAGIDTERDLNRISNLIEFIPSRFDRTQLWAEVALQLHSNGRETHCQKVVKEQVRPLLAILKDTNLNDYRIAVVTTAPTLFCAHQKTALEELEDLPPFLKDTAYIRICNYILRNCPSVDPYNPPQNKAYDVDWEDLVDLCEVLKQLNNDGALAHFVKNIADTLGSMRFSRQQRQDIIDRLKKICERLPFKARHIKHKGYKILVKARLAAAEANKDPAFWQQLSEDANELPNLSDRVFVLAYLAVLYPSKQEDKKDELINTVKREVEQIPVLIERMERYGDLAVIFLPVDVRLSQHFLQLAMQDSLRSPDVDTYSIQRRIVDLAHSIDSEFAASLASLLDDDPARKRDRRAIGRHLHKLHLKDEFVNSTNLSSASTEDYPQLAWTLLGLLNAGQIADMHLSNLRSFLVLQRDIGTVDAFFAMRTVGGMVAPLAVLDDIESERRIELRFG